ncbi:hypothetical protein SAMN05421824_1081 [Hyunsoonleella jejuensis]|uniref:Uncharacterized protein n=1 Tax=Hyunsoonleella jejuensis TaxID=419940 RepID=A0A1H9D0X3_9FLAO|nr:hypothetical protein SAMN05421824_1081 [Hyunsoonleella jejuensis]
MTSGNTPKYIKYAIGEIVLVVIGILIALQVNNWNEDRIENRRLSNYARSLIQDLKNDIEMLKVSLFQAKKGFYRIENLRNYMLSTPSDSLSNTDLFVYTYDIMYRPYKWNRSTFEELKSSGSIRYIRNDSLEKRLVAYESFSYHLDEDFKFDSSNYEKANASIASIINLNSPYFSEMLVLENKNFNDPNLNLFETQEYINSKAKELKLISSDEELLNILTNKFILIQNQYRIRAFHEMPEILNDAENLIRLLKTEYNL